MTEDATVPCIRYGELYTKFGAKIDRIYSYTNMSPENLRFSKGTEVLIPRVGEDPMDYNHCTWLSMPNVAIGEMISVFNTENNPLFTATMFNATLQNEFAMRVEGGSVTNLYFEKLKNIVVSFPTLEEQEKISSYFDHIDHLITLHQRKCEQTKTLKKYMLQKMFPQNGTNVPEIRFNGFTDAWEQRKVKDIAPLQRGFDLPTSQMEEGVYPVVMSNGIGGYHSQYKVEGPGIVTGRSGTIGKLHYIEGDYWPHNTTLWVTNFYGNNQKFIYYMYQCLDLSRFSTGSGVPTLNRNDVHDEVVCIPSLSEQKRISGYLTYLDHLITLHQRKCAELQNIKKFMLQNMFV